MVVSSRDPGPEETKGGGSLGSLASQPHLSWDCQTSESPLLKNKHIYTPLEQQKVRTWKSPDLYFISINTRY